MLTPWDVLLPKEVNAAAHELFTPSEIVENCDAQQASHARVGQTSESCWEAIRWNALELGGQLATIGVGVEWRRLVGGWRRLAQDGTNVESPSRACGGGVEWRRMVVGVD